MQNLRELVLGNMYTVDSEGYKVIGSLVNLDTLYISGEVVTDDVLESFEQLQRLRKLTLYDTRVSDLHVRKLQSAIRGLWVVKEFGTDTL